MSPPPPQSHRKTSERQVGSASRKLLKRLHHATTEALDELRKDLGVFDVIGQLIAKVMVGQLLPRRRLKNRTVWVFHQPMDPFIETRSPKLHVHRGLAEALEVDAQARDDGLAGADRRRAPDGS